MANTNSTRSSAAETQRPAKVAESNYDRLVVQIATLECVLATLEEWDLSGQPTDKTCRIASAELVLRQSIEALNDITSDVNSLEDLLREPTAAEVPHGQA